MNPNVLGTGWRFPIRPSAAGGLSYVTGEEEIAESIWLILGSAPRERPMLDSFGCAIQDYVFAPDNTTTRGEIANHVRKALTRWETRIDVLGVQVQTTPGAENTLLIKVEYRIRAVNSIHSLIYPFYLNERLSA